MENGKQPAYPVPHENDDQSIQYNVYTGLTKQEYACIKLGIPESGDQDIDALIRKSNRMRIAEKSMEGLLGNHYDNSRTIKATINISIQLADELLKELKQ